MFSLALSFLTGKKQIIIKYLLFLSVFALSLFIVYNKGISNGKQQEKNRLYEEYSKILEERLKENTDRLTREFSEKLDIEKNKVKIEKVYIEKKEKAKEIVEKSKNMNKEECSLSDSEIEDFNKLTRKTK